jgi:hypothetical protein
MRDYYNLGTYRRPVTTNSPRAQLWFDRGLLWCYGYNHEEAVRCFRTATESLSGNKAFIREDLRSYSWQGQERTYWIIGLLPYF